MLSEGYAACRGRGRLEARMACRSETNMPLVLILGQAPSTTSLVLWYTYSHNNFSRILPESH